MGWSHGHWRCDLSDRVARGHRAGTLGCGADRRGSTLCALGISFDGSSIGLGQRPGFKSVLAQNRVDLESKKSQEAGMHPVGVQAVVEEHLGGGDACEVESIEETVIDKEVDVPVEGS